MSTIAATIEATIIMSITGRPDIGEWVNFNQLIVAISLSKIWERSGFGEEGTSFHRQLFSAIEHNLNYCQVSQL